MIIDPQIKLRRLLLKTLRLLDEGGWGGIPEKIVKQGVKYFDLTFMMDAPVMLFFRFDDSNSHQLNAPYPGGEVVTRILEVWGLDGTEGLLQGFSIYVDKRGIVRWKGHGVVIVPGEEVES